MDIQSTTRFNRTRGAHHVTRGGKVFRGPAKAVRAKPIEDRTSTGPGTVICAACGASMKALKDGTPASHSPGGKGISIVRGYYACAGAGISTKHAALEFINEMANS